MNLALLPVWPLWLAAGILTAAFTLWLILYGKWGDDD